MTILDYRIPTLDPKNKNLAHKETEKMKYYLLKDFYPDEVIEQYHLFTIDFSRELSRENYLLNKNKLDDSELQGLFAKFYLDKSVKIFDYDFMTSIDGLVVGSKKLCNIIKKYDTDNSIRFIECFGYYHNGKKIDNDYYIIHSNTNYDFFDYEKSEYGGKKIALNRINNKTMPNLIRIRQQDKIFIKQNSDLIIHYFFLKNILLLNPIISEILLFELLNAGCKMYYQEI